MSEPSQPSKEPVKTFSSVEEYLLSEDARIAVAEVLKTPAETLEASGMFTEEQSNAFPLPCDTCHEPMVCDNCVDERDLPTAICTILLESYKIARLAEDPRFKNAHNAATENS